MNDLDAGGLVVGIVATLLLILSVIVAYAFISDRRYLHQERMARVPAPTLEARECKHLTTDFYQGTYNDLITYGEMLAEELQEPA